MSSNYSNLCQDSNVIESAQSSEDKEGEEVAYNTPSFGIYE